MPDYSRGKIYKITSGEMTYIGSTTEPTLAKRLAKHIGNYKVWKAGKIGRVTAFPLIETGQYEITLIELCPCNSKDELNARERYWIENTVCVNKQHPGRTAKEYYEATKDIRSEKMKTYYQANKEAISAYEKEWRATNKDKINAKLRERRARKSLVM